MDTLDDEDESVRIAIRALGDMKKGALTSSLSEPLCLFVGEIVATILQYNSD